MAETDGDSLHQGLKSALWYSIGKIVDQETINLGSNATPQFIGSLTELVWAQIDAEDEQSETATIDLESFARHADRRVINEADVMLLARRNEGLEELLRTYAQQRADMNKTN